MREKFDQQMEILHTELIELGALCEQAIGRTYEVLLEGNQRAAEEIIKKDQVVDAKEREIEDLCFRIILQQQPVARDLRTISAAMKMVTDMERIGDHAADISEITVMLGNQPYPFSLDLIKKMATETMIMLIRSIEAYVEKDIVKAQSVIKHDDIIDALFDEVKQKLITLIHEAPDNGEQATDFLMIAKYFERIGDHATNISEWVIFAFRAQTEN